MSWIESPDAKLGREQADPEPTKVLDADLPSYKAPEPDRSCIIDADDAGREKALGQHVGTEFHWSDEPPEEPELPEPEPFSSPDLTSANYLDVDDVDDW